MPNLAKKEHIDRFNDLSRDYLSDLNNNLRVTGGNSDFFYSLKIKHINSLINYKPKIILDFGCATGEFTKMIAEEFKDAIVIGYDPAKNCVQYASNKWADVLNLKFVSDISLVDHKPDLVIASGVFHHIDFTQYKRIFDDIEDIMHDQGKLVVFEHNPYSPLARIVVALSAVDEGANLISSKALRSWLVKSDFCKIEIRYISFFPPFLRFLLPLEKYFFKFPLGAQYIVCAEKNVNLLS